MGLGPANFELVLARTSVSLNNGVEGGAVSILDELTIGDLELGGICGFTKDSIRNGKFDLGAEVLVEVRVDLVPQDI